MKKESIKKTRSEKGAVTLLVVLSMLFMILSIFILYNRVENKKNSESRSVEQIQKQYDIDEEQMLNEMSNLEDVIKVSFDTKGGETINPVYRKKGESLGNLPSASKEGYTFEGWYTETNGGSKIDSETLAPDRNVTYYAHFEIN